GRATGCRRCGSYVPLGGVGRGARRAPAEGSERDGVAVGVVLGGGLVLQGVKGQRRRGRGGGAQSAEGLTQACSARVIDHFAAVARRVGVHQVRGRPPIGGGCDALHPHGVGVAVVFLGFRGRRRGDGWGLRGGDLLGPLF